MNDRTSRRHHSIATQSSEDLSATVATYDNPVESLPASPQQLEDDADTTQSDPEPAGLATTADEPLLVPGLASQPAQDLLQPRSPPIGLADANGVPVAKDVVGETDTAQSDLEPVDSASATVESDVALAIVVAPGVVGAIDMDVEVDASDEDAM